MNPTYQRLMDSRYTWHLLRQNDEFICLVRYAQGRWIQVSDIDLDKAVNQALDDADIARKEYLAESRKRR